MLLLYHSFFKRCRELSVNFDSEMLSLFFAVTSKVMTERGEKKENEEMNMFDFIKKCIYSS